LCRCAGPLRVKVPSSAGLKSGHGKSHDWSEFTPRGTKCIRFATERHIPRYSDKDSFLSIGIETKGSVCWVRRSAGDVSLAKTLGVLI
jgi:hypothetical protein